MAWLEARSLRKEFPLAGSLKVALDDFSLSVGREDFVGIVGRSGSGKTTFLRIVAGLLEMTSGELSFEGGSEGEEGGTTRPKIGMVFQEPRLLPWLSVRENVLFAFLNDPKPTQPRERADALIEMLGLGGYEKAYPSQLSGGMAQRVALGRALCYEPEMILMDEPLGALDYFTRSALRDEILGIYLSGGKTILLVTHDVEEAILLSRRIVVLDDGRKITEIPVDLEYPRRRSHPRFSEILDKALSLVAKPERQKAPDEPSRSSI